MQRTRSSAGTIIRYAALALAAAAVSCGGQESGLFAGPVDPASVEAKIMVVVPGQAQLSDGAWLSYSPISVTFEHNKIVKGVFHQHHIDISSFREPRLELDPGKSYHDGPKVNGRGHLGAWVDAQGQLTGNFPDPWIDLLVCTGPPEAAKGVCGPAGPCNRQAPMTTCQNADVIDVKVSAHDEDTVRLSYTAQLNGATVGGAFLTPRQPEGCENLVLDPKTLP